MENQGYEEEQHQPKQKEQPLSDESTASSRLPALHDSPSLSFPSTPPVRDHFPDSLSSPDGHVYEDISPESTLTSSSLNETKGHPLEYPLPRSSDAPSVESSLSAPETESCTFRRNLTLPFRRAIGFDLAGSGSSVRVTSREKTGCQDHDETLRASEFPSQDSLDPHRTRSTILRSGAERPGRRRRKKDCKHCRSRVGANVRESELEILEETILRRNRENEASSCNEGILATRRIGVSASLARKTDPAPVIGGTAVFSISEKVGESEGKALGPMEYERNDFRHVAAESEDKALIAGEKSRPTGMRVNSIYSQERWYAKEAPVFFTDVKEQNSFQRAYSLPVRTQTPSSQNRVNLRRSVRGEPPPHPARLRKHRHGWTLHLARPLEGSGCTRSLILLLIVILALLGVGAIALYIVFEPEKLQIIQQYLRSSNNSSRNALASGGTFLSSSKDRRNETSIVSTFSANGATLLSSDPPSNQSFPESTPLLPEPETEVTSPSTGNSTRYCDDCLLEEVCVALVDEEVPICRIALDRQDPTGCAGYCLINKQKCHRLDVDAFRCVEVEHYCLDDEWTCLNTLCIPLDKHCDGHMNCYDHSDEYNCDCNLETHFQCGNETSCLPLEKRCDGKIDCWDAADEINCTLGRNLGWSCPMDNEFTCSSGQCILKARFCDGLPDCADGSDEPHGCEGRCNKHEFTCQNNRCITKGMKCNGVDDCGDGTDERHCKDRRP